VKPVNRSVPFGVCWALVVAGLLGACGDDEVGDGSFGATCVEDADCQEGICFEFGSKGSRCTLDCPADPTTCPNDGEGCNDKGVCKVP
jgi:hypothetical protein